eukprot:3876490-Rhodomonas_salina.7
MSGPGPIDLARQQVPELFFTLSNSPFPTELAITAGHRHAPCQCQPWFSGGGDRHWSSPALALFGA